MIEHSTGADLTHQLSVRVRSQPWVSMCGGGSKSRDQNFLVSFLFYLVSICLLSTVRINDISLLQLEYF